MKTFGPKNFRDLLAILYFPFIVLWIILIAVIYKYFGMSLIEMLSLSTITGILLSKFGDIYQFYFRKAPDSEKRE